MTPTYASAADVTGVLFGVLFALLLIAGLYVWIALALAAVFRKSGEEGWKAWVPILNSIVVLQLGGLSPWLVLLAFFPILNIAFVVVFAIALYRINVAFGYGAGMTVLGVLLFPAWASVVGWGSARWVGREVGAHGADRPAAGPVRRTGDGSGGLPPLPPFPSAVPLATAAEAAAPAFPAYDAPSPAPFSGFAPPPAFTPATAPAAAQERSPEGRGDEPGPAASNAPAPAAASSVAPASEGWAPPVGGWTPPPLPGPVAAAASDTRVARGEAGRDVPADRDIAADDPWQGFALDSTDLSAEVTGAVPGAPSPISAVSPTAAEPIPFTPDAFAAPESSTTGVGITRPPVTRVPAPATPEDREPWRPARSPMHDADAFPESSGPVSAVAGAPDAGAPRAARSSVSAFHAKPEIPEDDDVFDHTIVARRKRTDWSLVPPTGDPIALVSEVVILGRRPASDPEHPAAQLVAIQDGTVSKTHARLRLKGDRWYVTDLDSTNGVLFATVMGTEVEATPGEEVEAGDRFLMGDAEIRLVRSDG
jgi:hypothetical protein